MRWYRDHQRDLPWRRSRSAYPVWVSEIMLQQTQVATVVPYFERFMQALPSISALAAADEHDVLRLWEGLGYYRRARQLHAAARLIVSNHRGQFPGDIDAVLALPGIGRYTAGAILSIAHDARLPIVEANSARLLARLLCYTGSMSDGAGQGVLWEAAESLLPAEHCGEFNQALMELGSLVCTPREPRCDVCPVARLCRAARAGRQQEVPTAKPRARFERCHEATVVVWSKGRVLLHQYQTGERWAGLWDFLRFPMPDCTFQSRTGQIAQTIYARYGLGIGQLRPLTTIKHGVTRFRITLDCYTAVARSGAKSRSRLRWSLPEELSELALSMTARKISRLLANEAAETRPKKKPRWTSVAMR